jgi:hypothetical protein
MIWVSLILAMRRVPAMESSMGGPHRGHFSSGALAPEQKAFVLFAQTSLWHDSQRVQASQEFYLSSGFTTCTIGQVLAISERGAKFWLPSPPSFAKVSVGCKPTREYCGCPSVWAKF